MANEIKLPELGEGIEAAQVLSVLVSPGDTVKKDQTVIEVETEKATAEVPSDYAGTVSEVKVKEGDEISVGAVILVLEGDGGGDADEEEASDKKDGKKGKKKAAKKAEAEEEPEEAEDAEEEPAEASDEEDDEAREDDEEDADEESDEDKKAKKKPAKAAAASRSSGEKPKAAKSSGSGPARRKSESPSPGKIVYLEEATPGTPAAKGSMLQVPAAPSVRRLARELGVDITAVPGTGDGGRISDEDVKSYARALIARAGAPAPAPAQGAVTQPAEPARPSGPKLPDFSQWGEVERVHMSGTRRATADAMTTAWTTAPMVTQFDRADITELEAFRKSYAKRAEAQGVKITVTAVAVKVAAAALKVFPQFNASVDPEEEEIIFKHYVNVGVAVDTERGLLVPVIRDADEKNVVDIARDLADLSERARGKKIQLDELKGGTFSVSNLGGLGTTYFSPIVNWPEVAILGMGRATREAVYTDGEFRPRMILPLAVTYDHRIIDGADAARFLRWVAEALENPVLLALEG